MGWMDKWWMHEADDSQAHGLVSFMVRRLNEERLPQVAGSLTFTTVLAMVPVLTIALAVFTTFPLFDAFRLALEDYFVQSLMPIDIANTILGYLNQFAGQAKRLSAVGTIFLFVTAVVTVATVERVFNQIWRVQKARPWAHRLLLYWAIVTLGPVLIGLSISMTSNVMALTDNAMRDLPLSSNALYTLASVLLTTIAFTLLYRLVPNRTVAWRDALSGGLLAGVGFEISKRLFAVFITQFPTYTVVYGTLAAVPLFLIWIYLGWLITLLGAVLAAALPVMRHERWWHVAAPGSQFVDAVAVLRLLHVARQSGTSAAVEIDTIREATQLGAEELEELLQPMQDAGWLERVSGEPVRKSMLDRRQVPGPDRWFLLANPQRLRLADVYRLFVFDVASQAPVALQVECAVEQGLCQPLDAFFTQPPEQTDAPVPEDLSLPEAGGLAEKEKARHLQPDAEQQ